MQVQQAFPLPRWPFSTMVAIVATIVAAMLAVALIVTVNRPATVVSPFVAPLHGVGGELVSHNRSEEGLGTSAASVSGEQVSHNRSEEGFSKP